MKSNPNTTTHCDAHCSVARTIKIIGSKWTLLILHNLMEGNNRFGQLQRSLPGISTKTLSVRLQELERDGIITRKVFAEVPLHVEYFLTEKGHSLKGIIDQMARWGEHTVEDDMLTDTPATPTVH